MSASVKADALCARLRADAERAGYHLNPDQDFVRELAQGLLDNEARYGYQSCPCRLSTGRADDDRDIVCPCDYRDGDLGKYGACYCALYVSGEVARGEKHPASIPESRPPRRERAARAAAQPAAIQGTLKYPVWRCAVCGYLCAREQAPDTCPICRARKDRFELFIA